MIIKDFGKLSDGRRASLYVLRNRGGMIAAVSDYGATLVNLIVPDKRDILTDVVLGHDDAAGYETGGGTLGGTVGRVANRIGGASFTMNGQRYELTANNGANALHGGRDHYNKRMWEATIPFGKISSRDVAAISNASESMNDTRPGFVQDDAGGESVTFSLTSPDGDQGFPGTIRIEVTYTLTDADELRIEYKARSLDDKDTPIGFTNHSYFNLAGHDSGTVLEQICRIDADFYTVSDAGLLPTGRLAPVEGTPLDFLDAKMLGRDIGDDFEALHNGKGYDHNFVLRGWEDCGEDGLCEYREVASLSCPDNGITMKVLTDMPGLQLYTANGLSNELGKDGAVYGQRAAACFETQFWPDTVNKEGFPGGILKAGGEFRSLTTYKFDVR